MYGRCLGERMEGCRSAVRRLQREPRLVEVFHLDSVVALICRYSFWVGVGRGSWTPGCRWETVSSFRLTTFLFQWRRQRSTPSDPHESLVCVKCFQRKWKSSWCDIDHLRDSRSKYTKHLLLFSECFYRPVRQHAAFGDGVFVSVWWVEASSTSHQIHISSYVFAP